MKTLEQTQCRIRVLESQQQNQQKVVPESNWQDSDNEESLKRSQSQSRTSTVSAFKWTRAPSLAEKSGSLVSGDAEQGSISQGLWKNRVIIISIFLV